jgi:uncharacterized protein (TIGR02186 family)
MKPLEALFGAILLLAAFLPALPARADRLVTDVSERQIAITSRFQGTSLLIFGAVQGGSALEGGLTQSDIVIVVRGPARSVIVRKKERVAGIWVNRRSVTFAGVPGYYAIASSAPLAGIVSPDLLNSRRIGADHLTLAVTDRENAAESDIPQYREALLRQQREAGLFSMNEHGVAILAQTLFRANLLFPANVPVGEYRVEVYLLKNGQIVSAQTSPLSINKSGIERGLYVLAHDDALLYGALSVLVAILAGWVIAAIYRRRML